ncbi:MAG: hypothetical protein ACE5JL_09975 [Dehalococcoidia bacterium]
MRAKRIVLLSNRSLLAAGVQRLLQDVDGLDLSIVAADQPEATAKIKQLDPHVIILDSGDTSLGQRPIAQMLEEHPRAKVVALNLNRDGIDVYRVKRVLRTTLDGLLEAIQGKGVPDRAKPMQPTRGRRARRDGGDAMDA